MFDFSNEEVKDPTPYISTSGYYSGKITRIVYDALYKKVSFDITAPQGRIQYLDISLYNKDGSKSDGYALFGAICKICGVDKPEQDSLGNFTKLQSKPLAVGVQFEFISGNKFPKKYVRSIHFADTMKTWGEHTSGSEALMYKTPIVDKFSEPKNGASQTPKTDNTFGEPPAGMVPPVEYVLPF
jgi:hypothetical protein